MFFKNWPYWLKGGIVLSVLYLLSVLIFYNYPCNSTATIFMKDNCFGFAVLFLVISSPGLATLNFLGIEYSQNVILAVSVAFISYFVIGGLIGLIFGLIYGKIKNIIKKYKR